MLAAALRPGRRPGAAGGRGRRSTPPAEVERGCPPERAAGRRGSPRLPRRLRLRAGLLGVGDAGPGRDCRASRRPPPRPGPRVLPGRQHLLARQRRALQGAFRRRLRAPDPRLQGPRGPGQSRPEGLPGRRGVRALGVLPAGPPDVAGGGPQGALPAPGARGGRGGGEGEGRHRGGERRRAGGGGDPHAPWQLPSRRRHRVRGRGAGSEELQCRSGAGSHAVRLRERREGRSSLAPSAALLQHPLAAAQAQPRGESPRSCGGPAPAAARRRHGAGLEHPRRRREHSRQERRSAARGRAAAPLASKRHVAVGPRARGVPSSLEDRRHAPPAATRRGRARAGSSASALAATATSPGCATSSRARSRTWSPPT